LAMLKFIKDGTQAFELEAGLTINEPGTQAVKAAVEAAVVELIKEGQVKGVWDFKTDDIVGAGSRIDTPSAPTQVEIKTTPAQQPVSGDTPTVVETSKVTTTKAVKKKEEPSRLKTFEETSVKGPRAKEQVNVQLH